MGAIERQPPYFDNFSAKDPALFLAGPIQGAPDWQSQAVHLLSGLYKGSRPLLVFNPRHQYNEGEFNKDIQVQWEKNHLLRAGKLGAIMFWFARRDESLPYEEGRLYAQTSRIEFGRIIGWKDYNRLINTAVGIEDGYIGNEHYIRSTAFEHSIPVYSSLAEVCDEAGRLTMKLASASEV